MSRVRLFSQCVNDEALATSNLPDHIIRHGTTIAEISNQIALVAGEKVAVNFRVTVRYRKRCQRSLTQFKSATNNVRLRFQVTRERISRAKRETENALQIS